MTNLIATLAQGSCNPKEWPPKEHCSICRFYQCRDGTCRRHAPIIDLKSTCRYPVFPRMSSYEWCGDFQPLNNKEGV